MELHCTREIYVYNIYMLIQSLEHYPLSCLDVICLSPPVLLLPLLATDPRKRRFHVTCLTYDDLTAQTWQQEIFLALLISALKQTDVISVRIRGICLLGAKINSPLKSFPFDFLPNNPQYTVHLGEPCSVPSSTTVYSIQRSARSSFRSSATVRAHHYRSIPKPHTPNAAKVVNLPIKSA
jgi:hypothetical protein